MRAVLAELNDATGARASLVVARDGMLVVADVREGIDLDRIAALGALLVTEVLAALDDNGLEGTAEVELAAERGKIVAVQAGPTYLIVLLGARLEIGPGSLEIRSAAARIAKETTLASA